MNKEEKSWRNGRDDVLQENGHNRLSHVPKQDTLFRPTNDQQDILFCSYNMSGIFKGNTQLPC